MRYASEKEMLLSALISDIIARANESGMFADVFALDHSDKREFFYARMSGTYQGYLCLLKEELEKGFPIEEISISRY